MRRLGDCDSKPTDEGVVVHANRRLLRVHPPEHMGESWPSFHRHPRCSEPAVRPAGTLQAYNIVLRSRYRPGVAKDGSLDLRLPI